MARGYVYGSANCKPWPMNSGSPSPFAICRPVPASGTASSTACSPSSPRTGAAKPLVSHQVIVQLIANTRTKTGLTAACQLDASAYEKGIKVSDAEMATLNIQPANFHDEWNYTIAPRSPET
jgi:Rhodopirellula transposase DDE domain